MKNDNAPFEIHVHGDVPIKPGTDIKAIQEALKPLWHYAGARSLSEGALSLYEEEPGIRFDATALRLQMCWTVRGDDDFRMVLDDLCMNLNELSSAGTQIEVTFYDTEFEDEDDANGAESRDDFLMLFVGPDPGAIMQAQRDLLVHDVVNMMERHFDGAELSGVVAEIDKLFSQRFDNLVSSLEQGTYTEPPLIPQTWLQSSLGNRLIRVFDPVKFLAGPCTTSPIRATPRWSSRPSLRRILWGA